MGGFALRFEGCFQSWGRDVGDWAEGVVVTELKINAGVKKEIVYMKKAPDKSEALYEV